MPHRPVLLTISFSEPNTYSMIYFHVFSFLHYTAPIFKASEYRMRKSYFKQHISHIAEKLPILAALRQAHEDCWELYNEAAYKKTNPDSATKRYFQNYTLWFKGFFPLYWFSDIQTYDPAASSRICTIGQWWSLPSFLLLLRHPLQGQTGAAKPMDRTKVLFLLENWRLTMLEQLCTRAG